MTADKLKEAITLIRSGDRQTGQKLLTEILNVEPGNETAWLWMSALMSGEKRRFCLEKVLSLNPNNAQARAQLAKLTPVAPLEPTIPTTVSVRVLAAPVSPAPMDPQPVSVPQPKVPPAPSYGPVDGTPLPKVWLIPGKHLSSMIYMEGNNLLVFEISPDKASDVFNEVRLGVTQKQFNEIKNRFHLMGVNHLLLTAIASVTLFGDALTIAGTDKSGNEKKINTTVNKEKAEEILKALQERLGLDFQRATRPISRLRVMMSAIVLFVITFCGTGFFWWFVRGLQADVEAAGGMSGSARARGISALLLLIGPNGFLCIGSVLLVIVIVAMISSLRKPPEETVIARGAGSEA